MSLTTPRFDWIAGLTAGCEKFVPPAVTDATERARRVRFVGIVLSAPFFASAAFAFAFFDKIDSAMVAASLCALCGLCWFMAVLPAIGATQAMAERCALALAVVFAGLTLAAAGGPASPLAAATAGLLFEAWWVRRSRSAAIAGAVAVLAAIGLQFVFSAAFFPLAGTFSAWQWLVPLVYGSTVWLRLQAIFAAARSAEPIQAEPLLETRIDAVVAKIAANGDIRDVSEQSLRLFHLAPELLLGTGLFERIHVADRVAYLCALADIRDQAPRRRVDIRLRLPAMASGEKADNYRQFCVEMIAVDEGREVLALIRQNEELAELRAELAAAAEAADSNEIAKNRFLAAVSHELRTPLNAILGFSDMLVHEMFGGFADPRQKEYVGLIYELGNHLLSVVNSILDVSKIESGAYTIHPEAFVFADAVEMCRSMMAHQAAGKSVSLRVAMPSGIGEICGDRRAIQQILINLVSNAVKFTPEGGSILMGAKRVGERLRFWVSDTGIGIAEADLKRLGQPFVQVQNDYTRHFEGTGLGLSLVKGLVVLHDGTMAIESAPGEGTTVTVTVPVAGPASAIEDERCEAGADRKYISNEAGNGTQLKTA